MQITQEQADALRMAAWNANGCRQKFDDALAQQGFTITPAEPPAAMVKLATTFAKSSSSTSEPTMKGVEQVARAICCARHRCEGCNGAGEGQCFDLDLWRVEATAAMRATLELAAAALRARGDCWTTDDEIADWLTQRAGGSDE